MNVCTVCNIKIYVDTINLFKCKIYDLWKPFVLQISDEAEI